MVPPYPRCAEIYPRLGPSQRHGQFGWKRRSAVAWAAVKSQHTGERKVGSDRELTKKKKKPNKQQKRKGEKRKEKERKIRYDLSNNPPILEAS